MESITLIQIKKTMKTHNIPAALVAKLVDISPSSMRESLRGEVYLGAAKEGEIYETVCSVVRYQEAVQPFSLPEWSDLKRLMAAKSADEVNTVMDSLFG